MCAIQYPQKQAELTGARTGYMTHGEVERRSQIRSKQCEGSRFCSTTGEWDRAQDVVEQVGETLRVVGQQTEVVIW